MTQSPPTGELVARFRDRINGTGIWRTAGPDEDMQALADALTTLERELEKMRAEFDNANRYLDFVARWAWRDGKHLSDEERLSSIKFYPPIKAIHDRAALQVEESKT